jgi:hypothetical protein
MNIDYWLEQVKATTAIIADLAAPVAPGRTIIHLPMVRAATFAR